MYDAVTELAERHKALALLDRSRLANMFLESLHAPWVAELESAWQTDIFPSTMLVKVRPLMRGKSSRWPEASRGDQGAFPSGRGGRSGERGFLLLEGERWFGVQSSVEDICRKRR